MSSTAPTDGKAVFVTRSLLWFIDPMLVITTTPRTAATARVKPKLPYNF
jgi:hypothetical protein